MPFDPTQLGATPIEEDNSFNPESLGATPIEDETPFNPVEAGAIPVDEPQKASSPYEYAKVGMIPESKEEYKNTLYTPKAKDKTTAERLEDAKRALEEDKPPSVFI